MAYSEEFKLFKKDVFGIVQDAKDQKEENENFQIEPYITFKIKEYLEDQGLIVRDTKEIIQIVEKNESKPLSQRVSISSEDFITVDENYIQSYDTEGKFLINVAVYEDHLRVDYFSPNYPTKLVSYQKSGEEKVTLMTEEDIEEFKKGPKPKPHDHPMKNTGSHFLNYNDMSMSVKSGNPSQVIYRPAPYVQDLVKDPLGISDKKDRNGHMERNGEMYIGLFLN